ncbi:MAG: hypothetical protein H0X40_02975 [Chthoniobacterales bacterium]|nr:hypothetical protein [Chthoniobacterales bacterium]
MRAIATGSSAAMFTCGELALTIGWTRTVFLGFHPEPTARVARSYGHVPVFHPNLLPLPIKAVLLALRIEEECHSVEHLVRLSLQRSRRACFLTFAEQRLSPPHSAFVRREAMNRYFCALDCGMTEVSANRAARKALVRRGQPLISERQLRRWANRVDAAGGPDLCPLDVFFDLKSIRHVRTTKQPHHGKPAAVANDIHSLRATDAGGGEND